MVVGTNISLFITEEFDSHTDAIIGVMKGQYIRLNTDAYLDKFSLETRVGCESHLKLCYPDSALDIDIKNVHSAYFRRPETPRVLSAISEKKDRDIYRSEIKDYLRQIYECLNNCIWLTHPVISKQMAGRINQLYLAKDIGFSVPETLVSSSVFAVKKFFEECQERVIIKSINSKTVIHGNDYSDIYYTEEVTSRDIERLEQLVDPICPFLLQKKIEKSYELRITVVGNKFFSARIDSEILDWRRDGKEQITKYKLPQSLKEKIRKYMEITGLRMGCFDMIRAIDGTYYFLEINPNGQWLWIEKATDLPISEAIAEFLDSPKK